MGDLRYVCIKKLRVIADRVTIVANLYRWYHREESVYVSWEEKVVLTGSSVGCTWSFVIILEINYISKYGADAVFANCSEEQRSYTAHRYMEHKKIKTL